ncbi:hypothetical protein CCYA_CCYA04G1281 [Cyanidiococcus yangmingshanensis]|nr:hypothetical protein CCYA_CCYA04G1281 [Cyanidiococcus yangmingshanensis]
MAFACLLRCQRLQAFVSGPRAECCLVRRPGVPGTAFLWRGSALQSTSQRAENSVCSVFLDTEIQPKKTGSGWILAKGRNVSGGSAKGKRSAPPSRQQRDPRRGSHPRRGSRPPPRKSEQQCFVLTANPCRDPKAQPFFEVRTTKAVFGKRATLRTRARRRLRAAARQVLNTWGRQDFSYHIQGLPETLYVPWKDLLQEMMQALQQAGCMEPKARVRQGSAADASTKVHWHPHQATDAVNQAVDDIQALEEEDTTSLDVLPKSRSPERRHHPLSSTELLG